MNADPRIAALPDIHGHAKGEHKPFAEERPIPYTARMLFLWFYHACRRASPRFLMVADHVNYLTFEDPAAVNLVRRALKLAQAGDLYGAAETAGVDIGHASAVSEGLRKGMRYSIGAEVDNDPRSRPDAQNIVDAMRPDGMIRSVHFLPITHPQHGENWMWPFDNGEFTEFYETVGTEKVWELYMTTLLEAIDKLPGHIVGHFYVPAKFGHWPDDETLESYEDRLIDACAERGFAVEINSRYFYKYYAPDDAQIERYRAAYLRLLGKAKAKGVMVAVGSDAHSPRDQGGAFDTVLALLDEAGINEIAFPINGRLARVALRATEEILRLHSGALANAVAAEPLPTSDDGFVAGTDDGAEDEPAAAAPAAHGTNGVTPVARVRPKAKPKAAVEAVTEIVGEPVDESIPTTVDEQVDAPAADAAPAPPPARKRPPKRAKAATPPDEAAASDEPEAVDGATEAAEEPATAEPEQQPVLEAVMAAAPEIVSAAAQQLATTVAETAQRAGSAIVEAAMNLVKPKAAKARPPRAAKPEPKETEPEATAATQPSAPRTKKAPPVKAEKPVDKTPTKAGRMREPAKKATPVKAAASAKKATSAKAVPAKKPVAKKAVGKKAARAARPVAKKAAARSAARPAAKATKKSTAARRDGAGKAPKRPAVVAKRTAPKKSATKKSAAKKKSSPSRR